MKFKKITAILSSMALVGGIAMAATPVQFSVNGDSSGSALVVGDAAASSDMAAATDLAKSFVVTSNDNETAVVTDGEVYELFTDSTELYLNDGLDKARQILTRKEVPWLLEDGEFDGEEYTQKIEFSNDAKISYAKQPESKSEPTIGVSLPTSSNDEIYTTVVTFKKNIDFTSEDSQNEKLNLFGEEYNVAIATDSDELVLYKSSEKVELSLYEDGAENIKTVTIGGKAYTIELLFVDDDFAKVKVTDSEGVSDSKSVNEGSSKDINGVNIGVEFSAESSRLAVADIVIGSDEIILKDGNKVKINDENIDGTKVEFETNDASNPVKALRTIKIHNYQDDDDEDVIVKDGSFSDPVFKSFKVLFTGLNVPFDSDDREELVISQSDDDTMSLSMVDYFGNSETFDWYYDGILADEDNEKIHVVEGARIYEDQYVVVGNDEKGYLLNLIDLDLDDTDYQDRVIVFQNVLDSNEEFEATVNSNTEAIVYVGGKRYDITYDADSLVLDYPDSNSGELIVYPSIATENNGNIVLYEPLEINSTGLTLILPERANSQDFIIETTNASTTKLELNNSNGNAALIFYEDKDDEGDYGNILVEISGTGDNVGVNDVDVSSDNSGLLRSEADDDIYSLVDIYGTYVELDKTDSDSDSVTIKYAGEQTSAQVYLSQSTTTLSYGEVSTEPMLIIKDNEIDSVKDRDLIIVGGSCINQVAASILGGNYCAEEFTGATGVAAGQALIKTVKSPYADDKIAMLVAGYNAEDTQRALSKVLAGEISQEVGAEIIV